MDRNKPRSPRGLVLTGLWLFLALTQLATLIGRYPRLGEPPRHQLHEPHWLAPPGPRASFTFALIALPVFLALAFWQFRRYRRDRANR